MPLTKNRFLSHFKTFALLTLFGLTVSTSLAQQVDTAWVRRYNGPGNGDDKAAAIAVDDSGNVYVTGSSFDSTTGYDYSTIKYLPNGDTAWVRRYNGPDNLDDFAVGLVLDGSGNVYVTSTSTDNLPSGCSCPCGFRTDYATIKYSPNGNMVWVKRSKSQPYGPCDSASALAIDRDGNIYVTGVSSDYCWIDYPINQYKTIKYTSSGDTLWVRYFGARLCNAAHAHLAVDGNKNVYVAAGGPDYITVKYDSSGNQLWSRSYNGPSSREDFIRAIAVDTTGNVYVTGVSDGDILTVKYDSNGNQLWVQRFISYYIKLNYTGGYALALDRSGNVFVTGSAWDIEAPVSFTIKYDSAGNQLWSRGMGLNHGTAIVVDTIGDAYVASNVAYNFVVKYDPSGNTIWNKSYSATPEGIVVDPKGNVYLTGYSFDGGTGNDFATIKYSPLPQLKGDLNLDGTLSAADAVLAINCVFLGKPPPAAPSACDLNCDGKLTAADVVILLNMVFLSAPAPC